MKDNDMAVLLPCGEAEKEEIYKLIRTLTDDELDKVSTYMAELKMNRKTDEQPGGESL